MRKTACDGLKNEHLQNWDFPSRQPRNLPLNGVEHVSKQERWSQIKSGKSSFGSMILFWVVPVLFVLSQERTNAGKFWNFSVWKLFSPDVYVKHPLPLSLFGECFNKEGERQPKQTLLNEHDIYKKAK